LAGFLQLANAILRNKWTGILLLMLLFVIPSCAKRNEPNTLPSSRQLTDEAGQTVTVPLKIERFVSLAPNLTEIAYTVGAGDRLVGNTTYCDYPAEARKVEKVGDTLHPSIERIIALRPQVVLVSTASQLETFTDQLSAHQIAVYVTDPHDLDGVFRSISNIGYLLNERDTADEVVRNLRARAAAVENAVKGTTPVTVFYQVSAEPLYTAGRDSFVTDLIRKAGGISVTADIPGAWPKYSAESALAAQPEAIILPTGGSMGDANSTVAAALKRSQAVANGKVYKINDDHLSRPGPRAIDGLEELAQALHPDKFRK
jgi:iron complex transport system substrate-binding protein